MFLTTEKSVELATVNASKTMLISSKVNFSVDIHKIEQSMSDMNVLIEKADKNEIWEGLTSIKEGYDNIVIENRSKVRKTINQHTLLAKVSDCHILESIAKINELKEFIRNERQFS